MKKNKLILFLGLIGLIVSCKTQYSTSDLTNNFTIEQNNDLKKIHAFFLNQICNNEEKVFKKCFKNNHDFTAANGFDPIIENIDFSEQKKIYSLISKSTFDEIWNFGKQTRKINGKYVNYKSIGFNGSGKYYDYLLDLSRNNRFVQEYLESISNTGTFDLMIFFQYRMKLNKSIINIEDYNIQLLIAIQYLSTNDYLKRKDAWEN